MKHLGDYQIPKESFPKLESVIQGLKGETLQEQEKVVRVHQALLALIRKEPAGRFLLPCVADFIEKVVREKIVDHYHLNQFELWLNQFSGLSRDENYEVRGRIVGRYVPRDEYQRLFPLGMGKSYPGSHFVTAHASPDLDTTIASFWGWVDAFGARVSDGLHVWNIPGGQPPPQMEVSFLFYNVFGADVFNIFSKHRTTLSVSSLDLVTQKGVVNKQLQESVFDIDHEKGPQAVVLVDSQGAYLGEWRSTDVDRVRSVINLLNVCLRWYENALHVKLISIFGVEKLTQKELAAFFELVLEMKIEECEPAREFTQLQRELVEHYLTKVLLVKEGLSSSFAQFAQAMKRHDLFQFEEFVKLIDASAFFDKTGKLIEERATLFRYLASLIGALENAIFSVRLFVDKLDVAFQVKSKVLGLMPHHINYRADLEEIKTKMDAFPYLTVTTADSEGTLFPLGVIHATDLFKTSLGTVTLRDFSNRDETKVPPFLDVISVIDHHKSQLSSSAPTVTWITDSQSSNALVAQVSFDINDHYSTGGMTAAEIEKQIEQVQKNLKEPSQKRILKRLLQKQLNAEQKGDYFVAPEREILEYFQCLYGILDDTDLLTKISPRDIECVASLLNRLKSLAERREVEVINFDDIPRDSHYGKNSAKKILQNEEMYSLYRKIYLAKEEAVEESLRSAHIFSDTKVQNGCCRVGQTKLFAKNYATFSKHGDQLKKGWLSSAQATFEAKREIDFHLHMISTLPGAEALYNGEEIEFDHEDEIWLWIPSNEVGIEHLKSFLSSFRTASFITDSQMRVELLGKNSKELKQIFEESFTGIAVQSLAQDLPIAVLKFRAGTINSRKAQISPYLPHGS